MSSSSDQFVYKDAMASQGTPNIFLRKEVLSINDNMNGVYSSNSAIIDTSQLSNSNKYMDYKNARLIVPLLLTLSSDTANVFAPDTAATAVPYGIGLKSFYGTICNSIQCEYQGITVTQQTNLLPIHNTMKLLTTMSWDDVRSMGPTLGFFPDNALSVGFEASDSTKGRGTCNTTNKLEFPTVTGIDNAYEKSNGGFLSRQIMCNYDPEGLSGDGGAAFSTLLTGTSCNALYKSYIFNKANGTASHGGVYQQAVTAVVRLKDLSDFFAQLPLLKGVFMKITLGLSNVSVNFTTASQVFTVNSINNPLGGVSPLQIASAASGNGCASLPDSTYTASVCVGNKVLNSTQLQNGLVQTSPLASGITLEVDAYTFSPVFEQSFLSQNIKKIEYEDVYQFQVNNVTAGSQFNQLITNGIAGMTSVCVYPYFTSTANGGIKPIESPFCGDGAGTTSPLVALTNFNVIVSGSNVLYNNQLYDYQQWVNNLQGWNSVNGGKTDGLKSGLISQLDFETSYRYYCVDVGRGLPVEEAVPKSVSIIGKNESAKDIDLIVFITYKNRVDIDVITGARVN
jgi:hypothetical protein